MKFQNVTNIFINPTSSSLERYKTDKFYRRFVKKKEEGRRKKKRDGEDRGRKENTEEGGRKELMSRKSPHFIKRGGNGALVH